MYKVTIASREFGIPGIPGPVGDHRSGCLDTQDVDCGPCIHHLDMQDADYRRCNHHLDMQDADYGRFIRFLSVNMVEGRGGWEGRSDR